MPDRMQQFIRIDGAMPDKRAAEERRKDFDEIYDEYSDDAAVRQASRCEQCGIPYCQVHCPLQNNIPDWLRLATEGRLQEAYETSQATNTFPEVCGRICPQDRLCEGSCVLEQSRHGTVTIGAVEKYITDTAWKEGWVKAPKARAKLGMSVGIIGGGPAGLAAADRLCTMGYEVHVYDRYDRMGGLLIYGIPNFKLEKEIVERRTKLLAEGGVIYHTEFEVGRDASLADLRAEHDAILIATGVYNARELQAPGSGLQNIFAAMDFLTASNRKGLGDAVPAFDDGTLNAQGKNVVVIGGGDTAMDCVRTAVRQGANSVKCLYRRDRTNMPGSQREVANAEEEGVEFIWLSAPEAFHGKDKLEAVQAHRMHLGVADVTGRQTPEPIKDSSFNIDADIAIKALGFDPEDLPTLFGAPELGVTRWGTVKVTEPSKMTELDGVFAAGDIYRGASLVVWAIRDGREAADGIHQYLQSARERADAA
ncbi:MAG: NAD(P)-dependent oxidoreductase [Rhodospirillales bacterium]|nr:NAD(P)-dependent oxidoreductase [Rhodospirillales bacterium]MBO6787894.1 NAD(P)-dependent oxidoreductase [Rhodospirillales bacterium]